MPRHLPPAVARAVLTLLLNLTFAAYGPPSTAAGELQAGDLDPTFGDGGIVVVDALEVLSTMVDVFVVDDGRILVGGTGYDEQEKEVCVVARFDSDGELDETFGSGGRTIIDFEPTPGQGLQNRCFGMAYHDGAIVIAGYVERGANQNSNLEITVARLDADGAFDDGFGDEGKAVVSLGAFTDVANAVAIQPLDGKIVVAGSSQISMAGASDFVALRLDTNGELDETYGVNRTTPLVCPTCPVTAHQIVIQPDGKAVVVGAIGGGALFVRRYDTDGTIDESFSADGAVTDTAGNALGRTVALQGEDILVGGSAVIAGDTHILLERFDEAGNADPQFGDGGRSPGIGWFAGRILVLPDGRILAGGKNDSFEFALARYEADGSIDDSFGNAGLVVTPYPFVFDAASQPSPRIARQADGNIVLVGDHRIVRYIGEDPIDPCGDANGSETLTATDALFALRSAVGSSTCQTCICDANGSGGVTATDALRILSRAVGLDVELLCPTCDLQPAVDAGPAHTVRVDRTAVDDAECRPLPARAERATWPGQNITGA